MGTWTYLGRYMGNLENLGRYMGNPEIQGHLEIPREIHGEPGDTGGFKDTRVEGDKGEYMRIYDDTG